MCFRGKGRGIEKMGNDIRTDAESDKNEAIKLCVEKFEVWWGKKMVENEAIFLGTGREGCWRFCTWLLHSIKWTGGSRNVLQQRLHWVNICKKVKRIQAYMCSKRVQTWIHLFGMNVGGSSRYKGYLQGHQSNNQLKNVRECLDVIHVLGIGSLKMQNEKLTTSHAKMR